jgi:hypothetical protein
VGQTQTEHGIGVLVDETGVEPATSSLRTMRSPS